MKYTRGGERSLARARERDGKNGNLASQSRPSVSNSTYSLGSAELPGLQSHLLKLVSVRSCGLQPNGPDFNRDSLLFRVHDTLQEFLSS